MKKSVATVDRILYFMMVWLLHASLAQAKMSNTFPKSFLLGFSTSSYQIEGAWNSDGKSENIWDHFTHKHPNAIAGRANANVAADSYHKYREDVAILKNLGAQIYRFSISWSRILPTGAMSDVNPFGIEYYNNLINLLLENNIQPMVTLYHWDLPQYLQNISGWENPLLIHFFEEYARVAFTHFGDRVKWWITFNEPFEVCVNGYGSGKLAPGVHSPGISDYECAHTIILAHAAVFHMYDRDFRQDQGGQIGITLDSRWNEPLNNSTRNKVAAETQMQFEMGWFAHPIFLGDYPQVMIQNIAANSASEGRKISRLPSFNEKAIYFIKDTADFLGLNHYTTRQVRKATPSRAGHPSWLRDTGNKISFDPSWPGSAVPWLKVVPWGFRKVLNWIKNQYNNIPVFVTENGFADKGTMGDCGRVKYHKSYIAELLKAIHIDKCNVIGYTAWSLIDNFEWTDGYKVKFGVYRVDFKSPNRTRTPKTSAKFFKALYKSRTLQNEKPIQ